jgi:hypothetical protein
MTITTSSLTYKLLVMERCKKKSFIPGKSEYLQEIFYLETKSGIFDTLFLCLQFIILQTNQLHGAEPSLRS